MSQSDLVYLNIGGTKFVTTSATLEKDGPNFFTALLSNKFSNLKDRDGNYFIDRPGKYFKPLLNYLTTGNIDIPKEIPQKLIASEAEFYGIKFPLTESDQHLDFITDEWLTNTVFNAKYAKISKKVDNLLIKVISDFKEKAKQGTTIQSKIYCKSAQWAMQWKEEKYWNYELSSFVHGYEGTKKDKAEALKVLNEVYSSERVEKESIVKIIAEHFPVIQQFCQQNRLNIRLKTYLFTWGVERKQIILGYQIYNYTELQRKEDARLDSYGSYY
jgi:hypothetical protein